jgi:hypothetical protein
MWFPPAACDAHCSWRPFCWGLPGVMTSGRMPRRIHHMDSCESLARFWLRQAPHGRCGGVGTNCRVGLYQAHRPRASGATLERGETRPGSHGARPRHRHRPQCAPVPVAHDSAPTVALPFVAKAGPGLELYEPAPCWPSRPRLAVVWRGRPPSRRANASVLLKGRSRS